LKYLLSIFILFALLSCSTAPVTPYKAPNPVIIPQDYFGVVHAGLEGTDEEFQLLNEMNVVWILYTFYWNSIEREKGTFDFSRYDSFVDKALQEGKKIVVVLAYASQWITEEFGNDIYIPGRYIPQYLNYVEALVTHYKGKIDAWNIWNEPNLNMFWKGTDQEYIELARQAAQKIRETDPDAYIIGGSFSRTPRSLILKMNKEGAMENLDALSFHPYALSPRWTMKVCDNFIKTMSDINFTGDILVTEMGFPTGGYYPTRVSLKNMPSYVVKTIAGCAARGTRMFLWYQFKDRYNYNEVQNKHNSGNFFGLVYPDLSRKDGAWAYELCARYLPASRYTPELPVRENVPSAIASFCFIDGVSGNTLILWNDINGKRKVKISLSASFNLHDISTGESTRFTDEITLEITNKPVFITWQDSTVPRISGN